MKPGIEVREAIAEVRAKFAERVEDVLKDLYELRDSYIAEVRMATGVSANSDYIDSIEIAIAIEAMLVLLTPDVPKSVCGHMDEYKGYCGRDCTSIARALEQYSKKSKSVILKLTVERIKDNRENKSKRGVALENRRPRKRN